MRVSLCTMLLWTGAQHFAPTEAFTSPSSSLSSLASRYSRSLRNPTIVLTAIDDETTDPGFFANESDLRDAGKEYLATCIPGLAPYLEEELRSCGVTTTNVLGNAAVSFTIAATTGDGDESGTTISADTIALKALIWVRTAHRILEKMDTFYDMESRDDVYQAVQNSRMHVKDLLGDGQGGLLSLSVKVIANGRLPKDISHSHYTALTIKNALVDQVRDLREDGERPNVNLDDPDVPLVAILHSAGMGAEMSLYRSLAPPGSLHRRGYRSGGAIHKAAMKESMAAGLLLAAGWKEACDNLRTSTDDSNDEGLTLIDPMCGSGSLLLEAAMMAVDFAPGLMRIMNGVPGHQIPPVLRWKGNKDTLVPIWKEMMMDASQRVKHGVSWLREHDGKMEIIGNDLHGGALDLVESSLANARGLGGIVDLHHNDCCDWKIAKNEERKNQQIWVMTNPPWGVRLSDDDHESWESLRIFLRENCPGGRTQAWVLSGNKSATKHLGLRRSHSVPLKTGQQDLRWIKYVMEERTWADSSRRETTTRDLNVEATEGKEVPVAPVSAQLGRIVEKTPISERGSAQTAPTVLTQENEERLLREPSLKRDSDEPGEERGGKSDDINAKPISPAPVLDLEQSNSNHPVSSPEPTNVKSYNVPPPRDNVSERRHTSAPELRKSQPTSPKHDGEEYDSSAPRQKDSASSSDAPSPVVQRDKQNRLIRTRGVKRNPSPTSSTLQRDDQQRLIRVRSSPGSRVPAGGTRARKSTNSGDDSWS